MNRIHLYLIFFIAIFITELLMSIIFFQLGLMLERIYFNKIFMIETLKDSFRYTLGRLKYHYPITIFIAVIVMNYIKSYDVVLKIALTNSILYLLILIFYGLFINSDIFRLMQRSIIYFNLIAIFLSPYVLTQIPYFFNLLNRLK